MWQVGNLCLPSCELQLNEKDRQLDFLAQNGSNKNVDNLTSKLQKLQDAIDAVTGDRDRLSKENSRLTNSIILSDQRVKSALLDHVTLHQRVSTV